MTIKASAFLLLFLVVTSQIEAYPVPGRLGWKLLEQTIRNTFRDGFNGANIESGCVWEGTAPWCNGKCYQGFDDIRTQPGADQSNDDFGSTCLFGTKVYCCKASAKQSWEGIWTDSSNAERISCSHVKHGSKCGFLQCNNRYNGYITSGNITGHKCDQILLFGKQGTLLPGMISFTDGTKWYK